MSKNALWTIIMLILIVVVLVVVFIGPGVFSPRGKFTRDEFTSQVGTPTNITRSIPTIAGAGEDLAVYLNINLGAADSYFIDEFIPQGFDIVSAGDGSVSTDQQSVKHIRYGVLSGATGSPTHYYILKVPANVSGSHDFYGEYVFGQGASQVDEPNVIDGIKVLDFPNSTLVVNTNFDATLLINSQQRGTRNLSLSLQPGNYLVGFENITDYVLMAPITVSTQSGKTTTVLCNYTQRDPADTDSNGIVRPIEINTAIGWFLNNQLDPFGQTYTISKLAKSISRFFQPTYFSTATHCSIYTS